VRSPPSPPLKSVEEVRRGVAEVATMEMPLKPHVSEKARSPSPVAQALPPRQTLPPPSEEVGSIGKDLETSLTQALEQQCTYFFRSITNCSSTSCRRTKAKHCYG
jgi:hypothetical protein